jgi:hypothetical protein
VGCAAVRAVQRERGSRVEEDRRRARVDGPRRRPASSGEAAASAESGGMTAPLDEARVISHERLMAAFADLNRMIEQRQQDTQEATEKAAER